MLVPMSRNRWVVGALALTVVASTVSCTDDDSGVADESTSTPTTATDGSTTTVSNDSSIDPGLQPYIDIAVADLAARLGVEPATITAQSAVLMVWSDGSLGCPKPGMQYPQVLTDGAKIVLVVDGTAYAYHAGGSTKPFLCESPTG
jgi:hypothetical protein